MADRIQSFSERLNIAMMERNVKQIDLAQMTGLKKQQISQYVNGKFEAKQDGLYRLAKALNVNEAWLMGYDVPMGASDPVLDDIDEVWQLRDELHKRPEMKILFNATKHVKKEDIEKVAALMDSLAKDYRDE